MISYLKNILLESPNKHISYAEFIGAALYHPEYGYYMKENVKIGRKGDFITTSNISDIYGRIIAKWFSKISKKFELPAVFCEIGAGNGRFAHAFLQEWQESIQDPLHYYIVESSPYHRKLQRELLNPDFSVTQVARLDDLKDFEGMVFSNELFDALPVHVIQKEDNQLYEIMIGIKNDQFFEEKLPLSNPEILRFLQESKLELKEKQRIEVPLAMEKVLKDIAHTLSKGLVVTADYGYTNEEWQESSKAQGSLRGYYQHQMFHDVLQHPGEMDITTHIHFDYLIQKGEQMGLNWLSKLRQDDFLVKTGILQELANHFDSNPFSEVSKRNRAIRSLIMPSGISSFFHILIQQKGLNLTNHQLFNL